MKPYNTNLPPHLRALKEEIEGYARGYGLDFFETIFEVIEADDLNEVASYGGFPTRYPHWQFGQSYEELRKSYDYGLSKIYELVINNDPCYAYLMRSNHDVDQKLVMAHVYGHCLAPETRVETEEGAKEITEVKVGERVLTHTGRFRPVRVVARRHFTGKIYCLTVEGSDEPIRITGEHPVYTLRPSASGQRSPRLYSRQRKTWAPAAQIRVGDYLVQPCVPVQAVICAGGRGEIETSWVQKADKPDGYSRVTAVETEDYDGLVYNFSVEEDESYTLAAGFAVHNCDFFKNNAYFSHTNRKMMDEMANHGARVRRYVEKYGEDEVERFMDRCMSIDDLIDIHSTAIKRRPESSRYDFKEQVEEDVKLTRFKSKDYMEDYINPREALKREEDEQKKQREKTERSFPEQPEKDVLLFLIRYAPLRPWQRDVLEIVRDEAYYFTPQGQTKILNEGWACLCGDSLIFTDRGLLRLDDLVRHHWSVTVSDGETPRDVYDWAKFLDRETVWIRTRRGYEVEGSQTHRLLLPDGSWRSLDEVQVGDRLLLSGGANLWAKEQVRVRWQPRRRLALTEVASRTGESIDTLRKYRACGLVPQNPELALLLDEYDTGLASMTTMQNRRRLIRVPETVDEELAALLGYLIGDGHISEVKRTIGLTTGDDEQADHFASLVERVFGLKTRKKRDGGRWRVYFSSKNVEDFLKHLGLKTGVAARIKEVPSAILRSPKEVVAAFLRALYDCDGYAGKHGVILTTFSESMGKVVQLLLLNYGILTSRRKTQDGGWHVQCLGKSAAVFFREVGFRLHRKQEALRKYVEDRRWFLEQDWTDEIVAIERRRADVYDISVEETHRYAAQGFINHNSYWHSTIMTQKALKPSEVVDFADHHSGTMATYGARLNPYKLGIELLRDIEYRWNTGRFGKDYDECDDLDKRRKWDRQLGLGRQKIFEVRRVHNDITFIDTFLTPDFCLQHKMFAYAWQEQMGTYVIESRDFQKIKQRLLFSLTNFGKPWIYVVDGNYRNRGELLLRHDHNGIDLRQDWAGEVLSNVQVLWSRPVHLQTVADGKPTLLSHDGSEFTNKPLGEADDPRRQVPAKTK